MRPQLSIGGSTMFPPFQNGNCLVLNPACSDTHQLHRVDCATHTIRYIPRLKKKHCSDFHTVYNSCILQVMTEVYPTSHSTRRKPSITATFPATWAIWSWLPPAPCGNSASPGPAGGPRAQRVRKECARGQVSYAWHKENRLFVEDYGDDSAV